MKLLHRKNTNNQLSGTSFANSNSDTLIARGSSVETIVQDNNQQACNSAPVTNFESNYMNNFHHLSCLGRGGFSVVFSSRKNMDEKEYAVKRIGVRNTTGAMDRITREVKALARLEHQKYCAVLHSLG